MTNINATEPDDAQQRDDIMRYLESVETEFERHFRFASGREYEIWGTALNRIRESIIILKRKEGNPCEENGCTDIENCDEICQHSRIYSPLQMQEAKQKVIAEIIKHGEYLSSNALTYEGWCNEMKRYLDNQRNGGKP